MNTKELRQKLHDMTQEAGSITAWAEANDLAFSYVAAVIRGDARPGNKILKAMRLRKTFTPRKTSAMKFEDID